jgi:hypothetical protein
MINFIMGALLMYAIAIPLLTHVSEPMQEEDTNAPLRFAMLWPYVAVMVIFELLIYGEE